MPLAAAMPQAIGSATVVNHCAKPVYYHVSGFKNGKGWDGETKVIPAEGFTMPYDTVISVKLFHNPADIRESISQLEFNLDETAGRVWYDISNVDAFRSGTPPFMEGGMHLTTSGEKHAQHPTCIPVHCPKGERTCKGVYNLWNDDKTLVCPQSTNLHLVLCPEGSSTPPTSPPGEVAPLGRRPPFRTGRTARALGLSKDEKLPEKRDSVEIEDLAGETNRSSKSHVVKLPVLGLLAGLACYFITML
jgi:hypothetical protein